MRGAIRLAAFTPLWVQLVVPLAGPTYFEPMFFHPPEMFGIPLGVVLGAVQMGWMLIGVAIVWNCRSAARDALALVFFTLPSTLAVILAPAIILILQNLG